LLKCIFNYEFIMILLGNREHVFIHVRSSCRVLTRSKKKLFLGRDFFTAG